MALKRNSRTEVLRVVSSFIAVLAVVAIPALVLAPAAFGQVTSVQPASKFVYLGGESSVSGFMIDSATGMLTEISGSPFPAELWTRALAADPQGHFLYVASCQLNNVLAYSIDSNTGRLTQISGSPFAAHTCPAAAIVDALGHFLYIANQWDSTISAYTINPLSGALTPVAGSPFGTYFWPVGMTTGPSGKFLYIANFGGQVSVYAISDNGSLSEISGSPYYAGGGTFQVAIPPSGKFAYAAAQYSGVFAYSIDTITGALTEVSGSPFPAGSDPYFVAVDPSGSFVYTANFFSNDVSGYMIDPATGALTQTGGSPFPAGQNPGGITTDSSGRFVYVANNGSDFASAFVIDPATGNLSPVTGSPFAMQHASISVVTVGLSGPLTATMTALASSRNPSIYGQMVAFESQVSSVAGTPGGTVQILNGSAVVGSATLVNGRVSIPVSTLPAGTDEITASYLGGSGFASSKSSSLTQTVTKAATTTSLTSSLILAATGQPITFTATVAAQYGGVATGTVTFMTGSQSLGSAAVNGNVASLTTSFVTAGTYSITARYNGDSNNTGSISGAFNEKIIASTTTSVTSSLNPSVVGQSITFTATVTSSAGIPANGESITFYNGSAVLGMAPLSAGAAMLTTSALPAGVFTITARYLGDPSFAASTSAALRQTVNSTTKSPTATTLISSLNPSIYGQKVTFTAQVTTSGPVPPTGTVVFMWKYFTTTYTIGSATLNSAGVATLTKSNLNADPYPMIAVYRGDTNNLSSTSPVLNQSVLQTTSAATTTSSLNPSTVGQAVTFTAKITSPTVMPSGPVTFKSGTTVLGTAQLSSGKATFTISTLPAGSTVVKVTYNGNSNIKGSSAAVTQTVQP